MVRAVSIVNWIVLMPLICQAEVGQPPEVGQLPEVRAINDEISAVWEEYGLEPSSRASDGEWCRRLYLDILGRIPSVQELRQFLSESRRDKSDQARARLVTKLLSDDAYVADYARNWTTIWTNLLIGRTGGTANNSLINRAGMQKYLRDCFARNKSYDQLVYDLVSATGSTTPGEADFNGAANFLVMNWTREVFRRRPRLLSSFLACKSNVHSATIIPSTIGSRVSFGK